MQVKQLQVTSWSFADEHTQGLPPQTGAAHWQVTGCGAQGLSSQRKLNPAPPELRTQISSESHIMPSGPHGVWQGAESICHIRVCALQLAIDTSLPESHRSYRHCVPSRQGSQASPLRGRIDGHTGGRHCGANTCQRPFEQVAMVGQHSP